MTFEASYARMNLTTWDYFSQRSVAKMLKLHPRSFTSFMIIETTIIISEVRSKHHLSIRFSNWLNQ